MRIPRWFRITVLLAALIGSATYLFAAPAGEATDVEAHWTRLREAEPQCAPAGTQTRWTIRAGDEAFAILNAATAEMLPPVCGEACGAVGELVIAPVWGERPGFFSGFGTMTVKLGINWTAGTCVRNSEWRLNAMIDTGRRGTETLTLKRVGWLVGAFVRDGIGTSL